MDNNNSDNNNTEQQERQLGGAFLVVGWIIAIALVTALINVSLFGTKTPKIDSSAAGTHITITRDNDSHFRVKGSINGIPVTFLIDTGATSVAVSSYIANEAKLTKESELSTQTANGNSVGYFTKIDKLSIAGVEVNDVSAVIVPNMEANQALLGMNVLQYFTMQQSNDQMILSVPAQGQSKP